MKLLVILLLLCPILALSQKNDDTKIIVTLDDSCFVPEKRRIRTCPFMDFIVKDNYHKLIHLRTYPENFLTSPANAA